MKIGTAAMVAATPYVLGMVMGTLVKLLTSK